VLKITKTLKLFILFFILPVSLQASLWTNGVQNVKDTWNSSQYDLYIPSITYHSRFTYDRELVNYYNENPWGIGFGKSRLDARDNWHGLYAMVFKDSHANWQPIVGYGWEAGWRPFSNKNFRTGIGFTAGVTARKNWNYMPSPNLLPIASISYKVFTLQTTYIPAVYHNIGNIWFMWIRIQIN
jgi:palmitoyl transferase